MIAPARTELMKPPPLQQDLLTALVHSDPDVAKRAAARWSDAVDLDTLDFASVQLLPMLSARADALPVDPRLASQITNVSRVTWLRTESHARLVAPAIEKLSAAGCDPILMKGAALVYGHGVPARLRPMWDFDVLVDPDTLAAATHVLLEEGFAGRDAEGLIAGEPRLLALKHGEDFKRAAGESIDLHWSALQSIRRPEIARQLAEHAVDAEIAGVACRALGRTDLLVVTIAHAADPWRELRERWVGDCVLLVRGHESAIDWDLLARRGRDWRLAHQMLAAFDYLGEVAQLELPPATRRALEKSPTPLAVRARRWRKPAEDGTPALTGRFSRMLEDYELEIADHVPFGARTGPGDLLDFLARRRGVSSRRALPGDFVFAALGRPWFARRRLRSLLGADEVPGAAADNWPRYSPGEELKFSGAGARTEYLANGWWFPEDFGIWSRGGCSRITLGLERPIEGDAELTFGIRAPLADAHPRVRASVVVNGYRVGRVKLTQSTPAASPVFRVPAKALAGARGAEIVLVVKSPAVPAELDLAPDLREIGVGIGELTLTPHT